MSVPIQLLSAAAPSAPTDAATVTKQKPTGSGDVSFSGVMESQEEAANQAAIAVEQEPERTVATGDIDDVVELVAGGDANTDAEPTKGKEVFGVAEVEPETPLTVQTNPTSKAGRADLTEGAKDVLDAPIYNAKATKSVGGAEDPAKPPQHPVSAEESRIRGLAANQDEVAKATKPDAVDALAKGEEKRVKINVADTVVPQATKVTTPKEIAPVQVAKPNVVEESKDALKSKENPKEAILAAAPTMTTKTADGGQKIVPMVSKAAITPSMTPALRMALDDTTELMQPIGQDELVLQGQTQRTEPFSIANRLDQSPQMARHVSQQVAYAVSQTGTGTTEIRLSPEELGRVRMTVQAVEGVVTISVIAERSETGDLMRRHADQLSQELKNQGFGTINLAFGNEGQAADDQQAAKGSPDLHDLSTEAPIDSDQAGHMVAEADGLDLRI